MVSPDQADDARPDETPTLKSKSKGVSARALILLLIVAAGVFALDQLAKMWVVDNLTPGVPVDVLGELLRFQFVRNSGAAFSLASGSTWIFSIIAASVAVFILWFARRIKSIAWATLFGMLLGGTLGNLFDRLFREPGFGLGHVVDFLSVWMFPAIFNLADVAIVSSMCLFILLTLRGIALDGTRSVARRRASAPSDADGAASLDDATSDAPRAEERPARNDDPRTSDSI